MGRPRKQNSCSPAPLGAYDWLPPHHTVTRQWALRTRMCVCLCSVRGIQFNWLCTDQGLLKTYHNLIYQKMQTHTHTHKHSRGRQGHEENWNILNSPDQGNNLVPLRDGAPWQTQTLSLSTLSPLITCDWMMAWLPLNGDLRSLSLRWRLLRLLRWSCWRSLAIWRGLLQTYRCIQAYINGGALSEIWRAMLRNTIYLQQKRACFFPAGTLFGCYNLDKTLTSLSWSVLPQEAERLWEPLLLSSAQALGV